ncbi:MAG: hypothetical protein WAK40_06075 [Thermoplasmata archaeon]
MSMDLHGPSPSPGSSSAYVSPGAILDRIYEMKRRVDAGTLLVEEFVRKRADLMTTTAPPRDAPAPSSTPHRELAKLDWLRDRTAVTGPQYLELRRRILFR